LLPAATDVRNQNAALWTTLSPGCARELAQTVVRRSAAPRSLPHQTTYQRSPYRPADTARPTLPDLVCHTTQFIVLGTLNPYDSYDDPELIVKEESPTVSVSAVAHFHALPDTPYAMWVREELADYLHLPKDGTRVEVIGGEIVVSPGPTVDHNMIIEEIHESFMTARLTRSGFRWRCIQGTDLDLTAIKDGYVPDLIVAEAATLAAASKSKAADLLPDQVELVVEVTSSSNATNDRQPTLRNSASTKWNGYAQVGIPYYLLVDRDPRRAQAILYSLPDQSAGTYDHLRSWEFGETIRLPDPFDIEIPTMDWDPWAH
jgi:Uma2 family endonuclease